MFGTNALNTGKVQKCFGLDSVINSSSGDTLEYFILVAITFILVYDVRSRAWTAL